MIRLPALPSQAPTADIFVALWKGLRESDEQISEIIEGLSSPYTRFDVATFLSLLAYCQMLERRVEKLEYKQDSETYERNEMRGRLEYRIDREVEDLQERLQDMTLAIQELEQRGAKHG